jgi:hypothetical protein
LISVAQAGSIGSSRFAFGDQWQETLSCDNSSMVVDRGHCSERGCDYQLVLRHRDAINYFLSRWAFSERHLNERGEFVMAVHPTGEREWLFFDGEENWSVSGRNLFRVSYVRGSEMATLEVRFLRGFGGKTSDDGKIAEWAFHNCRLFQ